VFSLPIPRYSKPIIIQAIDAVAAETMNKGKDVEVGNWIGLAQVPLGKQTDQTMAIHMLKENKKRALATFIFVEAIFLSH
jgi:hypothetical protein